MLEGRITYRAGDETHELEGGSFLRLTVGLPHAFRIRGDRPARFLAFTMPGTLMELRARGRRPAGPRRLTPAC